MFRLFILFFLLLNFAQGNDKKYVELMIPTILKIENLDKNIINIEKGNLELGKTGVIIHIYENNEKIILGDAKVISSNKNETKLEITRFTGLDQDSIPTSKRKVQKGDVLVLGYLYDRSMIITPDVDTFVEVKNKFLFNSFIHPDVFAAKLKVENELYPSKELIQKYAIEQNIGTIFIVVNGKVNVIDARSFKTVGKFDIDYDRKKEYKMPFYTRIDKIEDSVTGINFNFDKLVYETHYKDLIGLSNDKKRTLRSLLFDSWK